MEKTTENSGGAYVLVLSVNRRFRTRVGSLGTFSFERGTYAYVGNAKRSMKARVDRHIRVAEEKFTKPHWHIDNLLIGKHVFIRTVYMFPELNECVLAKEISGIEGAVSPVKGFGASDCTNHCHSHLFKISDEKDIEKLPHRAIMINTRSLGTRPERPRSGGNRPARTPSGRHRSGTTQSGRPRPEK